MIIIITKENAILLLIYFLAQLCNFCLFQIDLGCSELCIALTFYESSPDF